MKRCDTCGSYAINIDTAGGLCDVCFLRSENELRRAIVARLPKDAEGNVVYPGRDLVSTYCGTIHAPRVVTEIRIAGWRFGGSAWYVESDPLRPCYGSTDAAEKARAGK